MIKLLFFFTGCLVLSGCTFGVCFKPIEETKTTESPLTSVNPVTPVGPVITVQEVK